MSIRLRTPFLFITMTLSAGAFAQSSAAVMAANQQVVANIARAYQAAQTPEEKEKLKDQAKAIFYATDSDEVKNSVRKFFKENQPTAAAPAVTNGSRAARAGQ